MILRVFGHRTLRGPLLFFLWMILVITSSTSEPKHSRNHKSSHTKREDAEVLATNIHTPREFPYRYVFPANHPYSTYAQFSGRPTNNMEVNQHQSHNHQNVYALPQEYKYVIKHQPAQSLQVKTPNPFPPNSLPISPVVPGHGQSSPAPLILLVHAGPAGNNVNGPFQTFVLIPADNLNQHQHVNNLAAAFVNGGGAGVPNLQVAQQPSPQPYGNVGLPPLPTAMPITQAPPLMLFRPSHRPKNNNNHLHGLLQRPISVYPMAGHKYYSHKKNSVESRMSEKESNKKLSTSTETTSSYLTTRS